ncbi:MAG: shikimate kinase [Burkholderia sp.]|nr:shikimate kinase [Burkholderia sp.]
MQASDTHTNIFFVGLMGAGKTTVGRMIAYYLNKKFFDSDNEIEVRFRSRIPIIFNREGENAFRSREAQVISELTEYKNIVLATGGGAVLCPENRKYLKNRGIVIYLRASPHDLWMRTKRNKNRPLLQTNDPKERLEFLHRVRDPLYYECADFVIETSCLSLNVLINKIMINLKLTSMINKPLKT